MTGLFQLTIEEGGDLQARLGMLTAYLGTSTFRLRCHERFVGVLWGQFTEMKRREVDRFGSSLTPLQPMTLEARERKDRPHSSQFPILDRLWNTLTHRGEGAVVVADDRKAAVGASGKWGEILGYHQTGTPRMKARPVVGVLDEAIPALTQAVVNEIAGAAMEAGLFADWDSGGQSALDRLQGDFSG